MDELEKRVAALEAALTEEQIKNEVLRAAFNESMKEVMEFSVVVTKILACLAKDHDNPLTSTMLRMPN